jgi:predicted DNA-binding transcriptional regulator YafY
MKIIIDYTNWKGERSSRTIIPIRIYWGSNEWHKIEQWLMEAHDIEKKAPRNFALKDIHSWTPAS